MKDFVDQCRREWRRLGVPSQLLEEMAADLTADLTEAGAEGISVQEYLGPTASDARSFAARWASERGVVSDRRSRTAAGGRPRLLLAFTVVWLIVVIVATVLLATGEPKLSLVRTRTTSPGVTSRQVLHATSAAAPIEWILLFVAIAGLGFAAWLWSSWRRSRPPAAL